MRSGQVGVMDLMEKELFLEEANNKFCADCKTTKTPLWRGGPAGPKSLCNACGIRYRKRKVSMVGMRRRPENKRDETLVPGTCSSSQRTISKSDENESENAGDDRQFQWRIMGYGKAVVLRKQASVIKKQRWQKKRELGEEEAAAAAVSLMALSCGSVFA